MFTSLTWCIVLAFVLFFASVQAHPCLLVVPLLVGIHSRLLHVNIICRGRCSDLLELKPSRLCFLMLSKDTLLDTVEGLPL